MAAAISIGAITATDRIMSLLVRRCASRMTRFRSGTKSTAISATARLDGQLAVLDAVRLVGLGAEPAMAVRLVVLVVPLQPHDPAVALAREHVGPAAVDDPPGAGDAHRAA